MSLAKRCTECKETKAQTAFHINGQSKDGRQTKCKVCRNVRKNAYQATRREEGRAYWSRYSAEHREMLREKSRAYFATDAGRMALVNSTHKRRAASAESDITTEWLREFKVASTECLLCDVVLTHNNQYDPSFANLDHIIPLCIGGTHAMNNVRYICRDCNGKRPRDGRDLAITEAI